MKPANSLSSGFTLIELLVVISIIGVLSSVVLASLSTARAKSRDGVLRQEALQIRNLLELNVTSYGNFSNLLTYGWISTSSQCDGWFNGTYASQARQICKNIVANSDGSGPWGDYRLYLGESTFDPSKYSILIWLPAQQKYLCYGSSGQNSDITDTTNAWLLPGCFQNP